jgi:ABC-2 type transport system permease protein
MTTQTLTRDSSTAQPAARFRDLAAAEWIKLWSLRSTYWILGLSALAIVGLNVNAAYADLLLWRRDPASNKSDFIWGSVNAAFTSNATLILMLVAGSIGASVIVSEYSSGLIRTTFAAVPARRSVMAAKVAVVTPVLLLFGAVVASVSFWITQAILAGEDVGLSITYPEAWRVVMASALLAPIAALVGMAIGTVVRHTATTMVTTPFVLIVLPTFLTEDRYRSATIKHAMVLPAWQRLVEIGPIGQGPHSGPYPTTVGGSWLVLAAWTVAAAAVAVTALHHRDV